MSSSRHPIALRLEQQVGGDTRLLATVMLLPLVDGIFPALVLADAMDTTVGILQVGLLVFGGSATLAVILAEMDSDPRSQAKSVLLVGIPLIAVAGLEAALAPTFASVIDTVIFERFAAIVLLAIAAKTASATIGEYLPRPSIIIGLGAIASLNIGSFSMTVTTNPELIARAMAAGVVGVLFALGIVALQPKIKDVVDIDRFRFGSAVALGTLALSIINVVPSNAPLPVFAIAGLLAFDPGVQDVEEGEEATPMATTDGGADMETAPLDEVLDDEAESDSSGNYSYPADSHEDERVPWL